MLIYICDDSRADQLRLVHNIESYAKEKGAAVTVKLFSSADALLREYETSTEKPAVIFLDIYMDGTNGMDAAERLIELGMENGLVFTTSSEIHAVKAFSIGADGYLHKPFTHDDFVRAMKRFSRLFEESRRYITVMQGREEVNIYLNTLRFAESVGHSTVLHTSGGEVRGLPAAQQLLRAARGRAGLPDVRQKLHCKPFHCRKLRRGFRGTHLPGRRVAHSSGKAAPLRKGADEVRGKIGGLICTLFSAASTLWCS